MTRGYVRLIKKNFKTGFWTAMMGKGTIPIHAKAQKGRKPNPRSATQLASIEGAPWRMVTEELYWPLARRAATQ